MRRKLEWIKGNGGASASGRTGLRMDVRGSEIRAGWEEGSVGNEWWEVK